MPSAERRQDMEYPGQAPTGIGDPLDLERVNFCLERGTSALNHDRVVARDQGLVIRDQGFA
jgi:hypothetical protein